MASAFKPSVPVVGWHRRNPEVVYCFDSINKAAQFTGADTKSVLQVCRMERQFAKSWFFRFDNSIEAEMAKALATKEVYHSEVIVA